jgi:UDP-2,3-diacylglucosamine hydrolase
MPDSRPFLIVSDVHLGAVPATTERGFREFLTYVASSASGLLINGDLFDVWIASRRFMMRQHLRVAARIADVVDAGVPVYFVGGNHDSAEYGGNALREDLGVVVLEEPAQLSLGAWNALVIHGDGVRDGDDAYRKRHPILRSRPFRWIAQRALHLDRLVDTVAATSATPKQVARHASGEGQGPAHAAPLIEAWARRALDRLPNVNLVLAGHSHQPALVEVAPGRYYVNSGDWISHMTYVELGDVTTTPRILRWSDDVA